MRIGKPLAVTGSVLILVMLFGTCGSDVPPFEEKTDEEIEYTDVEYSKDGTGVTLYLDGIGVPKMRSQRAITTDLAKAAFDFIEVIFVTGTGSANVAVARTSWVLGQSANINNLVRGIDYGSTTGTNAACMFVGRDDGKILFGVGKLTSTNTGTTTITADTKSVTFSIAAIKSGLLVGNEPVGTAVNGLSVAVDSFSYTSNYFTDEEGEFVAGSRVGNSFRKNLPPTGNMQYPVYVIPGNGTTSAIYKFGFSGNEADYVNAIKHVRTASIYPVVQKKTPRYSIDGRYEEPRNRIDIYTTVAFNGYTPIDGANFGVSNASPSIGILFTTQARSGGFFAFNIQIPVYMVTRDDADRNNGTAAVTWYIRTGVGSEFYSLDDGVSSGGCVLMGVGVSALDWLEIEWDWVK